MDWREALRIDFPIIRRDISDMVRNNRHLVWDFVMGHTAWFVFFSLVYWATHIASLLTSWAGNTWYSNQIIDFGLIVIGSAALAGALVQFIVLLMVGALLVDMGEIIPNIFAGLFRRGAQFWHGIVIPAQGDEDIGLDKMAGAARGASLALFLIGLAHLTWWITIWGSYLLEKPIGFGLRTLLLMVFAAAICCIGYAGTYASTLRVTMDPHQRGVTHGRMQFGYVGAGIFSALYAGVLFHHFGWKDGKFQWNPTWDQEAWLIIGGILLLALAGWLKGRPAAGGGDYRWLVRVATVTGLVMLFSVLWPAFRGTEAGEATAHVTKKAAEVIEKRATTPQSSTTMSVPGALGTPDPRNVGAVADWLAQQPTREWELQNCLGGSTTYDLYLVNPVENGGDGKRFATFGTQLPITEGVLPLHNHVPDGWQLRVIMWIPGTTSIRYVRDFSPTGTRWIAPRQELVQADWTSPEATDGGGLMETPNGPRLLIGCEPVQPEPVRPMPPSKPKSPGFVRPVPPADPLFTRAQRS